YTGSSVAAQADPKIRDGIMDNANAAGCFQPSCHRAPKPGVRRARRCRLSRPAQPANRPPPLA
ncbi:MAG: hypothetical protein M3178_13330, partial [Pseudomonadota bacterium]|nr:hypothetical protein [Pseudomonadota bacterium]